MPKKLKQFLLVSCLAAILLSCISLAGQSTNSAIYISSSPPLTAVPPNPKREEISLNRLWQFIPAVGEAAQRPPVTGWGKIRVPGDWQQEGNDLVPGVVERGTGTAWDNFNGWELGKAWYRYKVQIPARWQGRRILLNLDRVSTDAKVYINDRECGAVDWPYGAVDLTPFATPGEDVTLTLLVAAAADEKDKVAIMSPNEIYQVEGDNKLDAKGLIDNVRLLSLPQGGHISDVFVQPSTRKQQVQLDVELRDATQGGEVQLVAQMFDERGKVEKEFTAIARVAAKPLQTLQVAWKWDDPRLWDLGQPNLYTLRLGVKGQGIEDEYDQSFGFREFWIEGRKFYLNGTEFRLRPTLQGDNWQGWGVGTPEVLDGMLAGYEKAGYNIAEPWPWNYYARGRWHFRGMLAERADLKGFPLIAPALDMVRDGYVEDWKGRTGKRSWEPKLARELRRDRNHPSILMWANSPNYFGYSDDQNPRRIGMKRFQGGLDRIENKRVKEVIPIGEDAIATIKKYDPTRPAMMHQGAAVGDVYALNSYLNIIPLQEREEWLSDWSKVGEMPYMVVEFGTPLHASMMRGHNGFNQAIYTEPLMTEYSAIYLGNEAYKLETEAYRSKIRDLFVKDQEYKNWQNVPELDFSPAFQKLQHLFITNTWRSWRTYGVTGGMIPWSMGHGWEVNERGKEWMSLGEFEPGRRGPFPNKVFRYFSEYLNLKSYEIYPGGKALLANNGPTLAWIAGSQETFVAKDHSFFAKGLLQKQAVLINDTRTEQPFSFHWKVRVENKTIATGEKTGKIATAKTLFFPIEAELPEVSSKTEGEIVLTAKIGTQEHRDRFPFRVFPTQAPALQPKQELTVFDPVGKTTQMLRQLGYQVVPWRGSNTDSVLVIGREVLSRDRAIPRNLEAFVRNGGRVIICTQKPDWIEKNLGLRVAKQLSRRVFPVNSTHSIVRDLDEFDLRDWNGESTLVEAYPNTIKNPTKRSSYRTPWYGWHWGNRGAVSSAAIEKPHLSGWRPILETEFDLAYSLLLELNYGKGRIILNTLDLEDHFQTDPAARQIAKQIIDYSATEPSSLQAEKVVLLGSKEDANFLDKLGAIYQRENKISADADLVIVGSQAQVDESELHNYLQAGGKAFFLPQRCERRDRCDVNLGVTLKSAANFQSSLTVPNWSELRGISASDLHSRTNYNAWVVDRSADNQNIESSVAEDGLFARKKVGDGVAIFCQLDPENLDADTATYFRLTRWRHTRAIAQILANLGASFQTDRQIFNAIEGDRTTSNKFPFYSPDYRADFDLGDDPYRYYRW